MTQGWTGQPDRPDGTREYYGVVISKTRLQEIAASPDAPLHARLEQMGAALESRINTMYWGQIPMICDVRVDPRRRRINLADISSNVLLLNLVSARLREMGFPDYIMKAETRFTWITLRIACGEIEAAAKQVSLYREDYPSDPHAILAQAIIYCLERENEKAVDALLSILAFSEDEAYYKQVKTLSLLNLAMLRKNGYDSPKIDSALSNEYATEVWEKWTTYDNLTEFLDTYF